MAKAKVENIRLHDLRHFFASGLITQGCDVVTIQRVLGHTQATTTLGTYPHLWPTTEDRTRSATEAMMTESFEHRIENLADFSLTGSPQ